MVRAWQLKPARCSVNRLFLTTTHFHPEHAGGVPGFPAGTLLIRNQVQQDEMDRRGEEMIQMFAGRNEMWKILLSGEQLRAPDKTFERELRLNLGGGATARLLWFGAAHTKGDELVFVDPDKALVPGDVVQNKVGPYIYFCSCCSRRGNTLQPNLGVPRSFSETTPVAR